jgi:N-acetylglucosamine malate deacetylase 1
MNILALGSHPDDVEIFAGGTLLRYKQLGHRIFIALTTSGNIGSPTAATRDEIARVREAEQLEAAKLYDAEVRFLRFDDELFQDTAESRRAVLSAMRWANPDVILTNPPFDASTDHGTTGTIVTKVLLSLPAKLVPADEPPVFKSPSVFFWDTGGGIGFEPEVYVDISNVIDQKLEAVERHVSQAEWLALYSSDTMAEYSRTIARFRGIQAGFTYAEGFRAHRVHGFMPDFHLLPRASDQEPAEDPSRLRLVTTAFGS